MQLNFSRVYFCTVLRHHVKLYSVVYLSSNLGARHLLVIVWRRFYCNSRKENYSKLNYRSLCKIAHVVPQSSRYTTTLDKFKPERLGLTCCSGLCFRDAFPYVDRHDFFSLEEETSNDFFFEIQDSPYYNVLRTKEKKLFHVIALRFPSL